MPPGRLVVVNTRQCDLLGTDAFDQPQYRAQVSRHVPQRADPIGVGIGAAIEDHHGRRVPAQDPARRAVHHVEAEVALLAAVVHQ